ncbi:MAG: nucleotidyltransferase domain-containing protein [Candidatus Pacearchaeota archaeon]
MITKGKDYFSLTQSQKSKIKKIIYENLKKNPKVKMAFLYGSFIDRSYFQDIDVAIIGKLTMNELMDLKLELSKKTGFEVDIKCFSSLNEIPEPFKFSILHGELLKKGRREDFESYKHESILRYIDFLEFRSKRW